MHLQDLNHLLEAVLILDQKGAQREAAKNPDPFPPRAVGSARGSRKSSFSTRERQREIQKENERLLRVRKLFLLVLSNIYSSEDYL